MRDTSKTIGNYDILSTIASGSFGRVYLARHSVLTTRIVALKLMHTLPFSLEKERKEFLQEAQILELLQHPYILPILDVGIYEDIPYIVSEYASGNSLRKRLQGQGVQPLPLEDSLAILSQVGQALQYAHDQNIIHRDIKPENILFNAKGHALLADFGLATTLATASIKDVTNIGTPRYMAPEQFRGRACKESDQYALGCVAYELFTGHRLFHASDTMALLYQHVNVLPTPPTQHNPQLPVHIEQAVLKALMKQRNERHSSVSAFIAALQVSGSTRILEPATAQSAAPAQTGSTISEFDISTLLRKTIEDSNEVSGEEIKAPSSITQASSKKLATSLSTPQQSAEKVTFILHDEEQGRPDTSLAVKHKSTPGLLIAITCILLGAIISGTLVWALYVAPSANRSAQKPGSSPSALLPLHNLTAKPTLQTPPSVTPTHPAKPQPAMVPTSQAKTITQPAPATRPTHAAQPAPAAQPTPIPSYASSYYVCGDQVSLTNLNAWTTVQPNATVSTTQYSGPVNSYAGPSGNPKNSPENCSGRYQWAWNQNPAQAQWTWSNAYLPHGTCNVSIHVPSWYEGAPDAQYTLAIASSAGSTNYAFDAQNQNQAVTTWLDLRINSQVPSIHLPNSTNSTYTLTLTLKNGGTPNWYLGADAIRFNCSSSSPTT